jgi:hypothetical protein
LAVEFSAAWPRAEVAMRPPTVAAEESLRKSRREIIVGVV